ncbi:acetyl-CoA carboxylase biotin carboxyl carrier protein subunit [Prolixibacteraceae bacterium JC049]|nr:acetyl-CoA carboxylase biotin carboxyl carrier protein subunit [Prolixibacteraceae bacterium JC049]
MPKSLLQRVSKLYANTSGKNKYAFSLPIEDKIKVGRTAFDIKLKEDDKLGTYILWKNRKYPVEVISQKNNKFEILFNGVSYTYTIETPISMKRLKFLSRKKGASDIETISAPMPGKIVDILVQENAEVRKGEAVLILEAMKMQNEIQSLVDGKIVSIRVRPNDNVMKDELLIEIKKS